MTRDFIFIFFVFLIVRYMLARNMAGNNINMKKGIVYSFFYAVAFIVVRYGWNASYKVRSKQPDTDKDSR